MRELTPHWHLRAACVGMDEAAFFGARDTTERPALSVADVARAKTVCQGCPVFRECLTKALGAGKNHPREEYGIWAGTSGRTRRRIWDLVEREEVTMAEVIDDICSGLTERYERNTKVTLSAVVVPTHQAVSA